MSQICQIKYFATYISRIKKSSWKRSPEKEQHLYDYVFILSFCTCPDYYQQIGCPFSLSLSLRCSRSHSLSSDPGSAQRICLLSSFSLFLLIAIALSLSLSHTHTHTHTHTHSFKSLLVWVPLCLWLHSLSLSSADLFPQSSSFSHFLKQMSAFSYTFSLSLSLILSLSFSLSLTISLLFPSHLLSLTDAEFGLFTPSLPLPLLLSL